MPKCDKCNEELKIHIKNYIKFLKPEFKKTSKCFVARMYKRHRLLFSPEEQIKIEAGLDRIKQEGKGNE